MGFFPKLGILNPFDTIGDAVLIEPIARQIGDALDIDVYVICTRPELFIGHQSVRSLKLGGNMPDDMRIINMEDAIRSMILRPDKKSEVIENKLNRMYEAAGLKERHIKSPKLYLSDGEEETAHELNDILGSKRIGIALGSKHKFKNIPYTKALIKQLARRGWNVFAFGQTEDGEYDYLNTLPVTPIVNQPLRKAMMYIALMDVFVGPDTGIMHVAGALEVPFVVATREMWRDLYDCYDVGEIIAAKQFGKHSLSSWSVTPRRILKAIDRQAPDIDTPAPKIKVKEKETSIALFRLDGLGGTLTLSDQAKKVHDMTGIKPDLIVRSYATAFRDNPHVDNIIEVGNASWGQCLEESLERYDVLGEVRFAPAMWYQKVHVFDKKFPDSQDIYDAFPHEYRRFEKRGLHHVQLTDEYLGLPADQIEMEVFYTEPYLDILPEGFLAVSNGVDQQYKNMRQTKTWDGWNELIPMLSMPVVQVGTLHDPRIEGAVDLRGKTALPELFDVLNRSDGVLCTEGGMMHLAYALSCENVFVMRGPTRGKLFEYPGQNFIDSYICDICWSSTGDWYVNCPQKVNAACMKSISPERVATNIQEVLC